MNAMVCLPIQSKLHQKRHNVHQKATTQISHQKANILRLYMPLKFGIDSSIRPNGIDMRLTNKTYQVRIPASVFLFVLQVLRGSPAFSRLGGRDHYILPRRGGGDFL